MIHQPWLALVGTDPIQCIPSYTNTNTYDVEVALVEEGECGFEAKRAAVEVDQDWKLLVMVFKFWKVKPCRD
ncbi:hypothetical protein Ahy_A09g042322 isoform C [Arachis hypogaea]|uniref:Uncharacterized protein n=1 Tax=Arachis hypogaea TaxID=3818 RepID=A0A445BFM1_ARAHY|nr:hypothetical protein Ahy_A09g042322 isoform C [Arachis hypogaea]